MKKIIILVALVGAAAFAFGFTGNALAQTVEPPVVEPAFGPGRMGAGMRGGMMGGPGDGTGLMHDAMVSVLAEKLGLTVDELNSRLEAGETVFSIAGEQGLTIEEFHSLMAEARAKALDQAAADGTITREQADFMKERGAGRRGGQGRGGAFGNCPYAGQNP